MGLYKCHGIWNYKQFDNEVLIIELWFGCYRMKELKSKDEEKKALEKAKNDLETFIVDTQDKLWQEIYEKSSTEEDRETLRTTLSEAYDWLYEVEDDSPRKVRGEWMGCRTSGPRFTNSFSIAI